MKILIAEDDRTTRQCLVAIVERHGHEALEAVDGLEAWEIMRRPDAPRLVLLDWMMPGLDGLEVCRRVRAVPTDRPPYVIMLTGKGGEGDAVECLDGGADDFLAKPFAAAELRARVDIGRRMVETLAKLEEKGERRLRESEERTNAKLKALLSAEDELGPIELGDVIDVQALQALMDRFFALTGIGVSIAGNNGKTLVATGGRDAPAPPASGGPGVFTASEGEDGLWDMATPIIIGGAQVGKLSLERFRFDDEPAGSGGDFPRWSRGTVAAAADFHARLASMISAMGYARIKMARALAARDKALAFSQDRTAFLGMLQDTIPLPLYVKDAEGLYLDFNQAFGEFFGHRRGELTGKTVFSVFPPGPAEFHGAKDLELLGHPGKQVFESKIKDAHGNSRDVVFHKATFKNAEGDVGGLIGVFLDITESKLAGERERLAHDVLGRLNHPGSAVNAIRDILLMVRTHLGVDAVGIRLSDGDDFPYYETSGFSDGFVKLESHLCSLDNEGKPLLDERGKPQLGCLCGRVLDGQATPETPFFTAGGSFWTNSTTDLIAWARTNDQLKGLRNHCNQAGYESVALIPLRMDAARVGLLQLNDRRRNLFTAEMIRFFEGLGAGIGIALSRKRAEEELWRQEEEYRSLVASIPGVSYRYANDADWTVNFISDEVAALTGHPAQSFLGRPARSFAEIIHPEDRAPSRALMQERMAAKEMYELDYRLVRADGETVWVHEKGRGIFDADGKLLCLNGVIVDISGLKRLERTRLEHEKTMRRNEKFSTLGALVASVAHEINNPNSVITMSVPFLRKVWAEAAPALLAASRDGMLKAIGKLPPEQALTRIDDMLGGIHRASQRIKRIVQLLRDYIREQPAELRQDTVNLNEILSSAIDMLGSRLKHATNRLDVRLADTLPPIKGDFQRLEQVFINLLVNSCDALTDKEQAIAVSSGWSPETGEIRVVVRDEGGGMPEDVLSRVGEPLMTTKHDRGGTGLGVSISMDIVREHGGQILYESKPGGGTTATVIFKPMNR